MVALYYIHITFKLVVESFTRIVISNLLLLVDLTDQNLFNKFYYLNQYLTNVPILHPVKTFGFLVFSGVIKWEHWPEMGQGK